MAEQVVVCPVALPMGNACQGRKKFFDFMSDRNEIAALLLRGAGCAVHFHPRFLCVESREFFNSY
jgi:hypothetical protein